MIGTAQYENHSQHENHRRNSNAAGPSGAFRFSHEHHNDHDDVEKYAPKARAKYFAMHGRALGCRKREGMTSTNKKLCRASFLILLFGCATMLGAYWHHLWVFPFPQISRWNQSLVTAQKTQTGKGAIQLEVRSFKPAIDPAIYETERDSTYQYRKEALNLQKTALVLIDVWANHPNEGWTERARQHTADKISPLVDLARRNNILVFHAPHGRPIAEIVQPYKNEINLDDKGLATTEAFHRFLRNQGVNTLLYAGYASNWCVLHRPVGIIRMRQLGYNIILIRDCTIAFETPETLDGQWANKVTVNTVEHQWGATTTLHNLGEALRTREQHRAEQ